jgi:hypothetical protein
MLLLDEVAVDVITVKWWYAATWSCWIVLQNHLFIASSVILLLFYFLVQGHDGVDLEMSLNANKFRSEDDGFSDVVCCFFFVGLHLL